MKKVFIFLIIAVMCSVCILVGIIAGSRIQNQDKKELPVEVKTSLVESPKVLAKKKDVSGVLKNGINEFREVQTKLNFK